MDTPNHFEAHHAQAPPSRAVATVKGVLRLCLVAWLLMLCTSAGARAEQMVTLLTVNGQEKGEIFLHRTEDGDFLVLPADLEAAGLKELRGTIFEVEGEPHLSLRSVAGIAYAFDERTLTLRVDADPALLPTTVIDFGSQPKKQVHYPKESSLFLNYGLEYRAGSGGAPSDTSLTNELGVRRGDYLFLTDTLTTSDRSRDTFTRLHTSLTRDDRERMRRTVFGDLFASSGTLGSGTNIGGVSFSKVYGIDPFFVTYPTLEVTGQAALPSEVDIYLNGAKIRTERVPPGEFQLNNFSTYGGAGEVELVIRDALGREQRFTNPFYATDNLLLKTGLHDYSYSAGFLRDRFGQESNRYSDPVAVALHRFGYRDFATVGWRGEASPELFNAGALVAVRLGTLGLANAGFSGSLSGGAGAAFDLTYQYLNRRFNGRLFYQHYSPGYRTLASAGSDLRPNYSRGGSVSYTNAAFGSLSFDLSGQKTYQESERRTVALGYSKSFPRNLNLTAILRRVQDPALGSANEILLGLSYTPASEVTFSARHESAGVRTHDSLQAQKNPPLGEGIGYRALLERDRLDNGSEILLVNPMVQYNGRYGIVRGEMATASTDGTRESQYNIGASGALVMLDGVAALTRPVADSFAVVKVGDIEGVTVRYGGQDICKTDASGRAVVTNLSAYNDNVISINEKEIPFEYYFPQVKRVVSPPIRSGCCIGFLAKKFQPVTGVIKAVAGGKVAPVEFQELELLVGETWLSFPTGQGGEFYIDMSQSQQFMKLALDQGQNCAAPAGEDGSFMKPGTYQAAVTVDGRRHRFSLWVPSSEDPIIDLGLIVVDTDAPLSKQEER